MPQVSMSPQTFANLEEQINQHPDKFESFTVTSPNTGIIVTKDVTIDYLYNALTQFLQFNIGAKHSLAARIAGDNIIAQHVIAVIHDLPPVEAKPEPEPEPEPEIEPSASTEIKPKVTSGTTTAPGIVVKTPTPATTEVTNGGTSGEQIS